MTELALVILVLAVGVVWLGAKNEGTTIAKLFKSGLRKLKSFVVKE